MSVDEALTLIRAVTHPYPGAFIYIDNKKYLIWSAEKSDIKTDFMLADGYIRPIEYLIEE